MTGTHEGAVLASQSPCGGEAPAVAAGAGEVQAAGAGAGEAQAVGAGAGEAQAASGPCGGEVLIPRSNTVPNRAAICETLMAAAAGDRDVTVLCSDSRGSGSMTPFFEAFPGQAVEVGIAEQDLVGIAAGMAACGKKSFAVSPACFLTTRSYEQCKVDVAYSRTNVKLVGISGGVSYGALGMSHHSAQDLAAMSAIPGMRVYVPSDRFQTAALVRQLLEDEKPAYIRVGRNAVPDIYDDGCCYRLDRATRLRKGDDVAILALGELVAPAVEAADLLAQEGVGATVLDLCSVKPLDAEGVLKVARHVRCLLCVEEASPFGGVGSQVAQLVGEACPRPVRTLALPDAPVVTGTSAQVFAHYGLDAAGIAAAARDLLAHQMP